LETLKRLRKALPREKPELWPNDCILHHVNAPDYKALSVKEFLAKKSITEIEHTPYSPHLDPNGFWLFTAIKSTLKGR
jgi:hypothetical protein